MSKKEVIDKAGQIYLLPLLVVIGSYVGFVNNLSLISVSSLVFLISLSMQLRKTGRNSLLKIIETLGCTNFVVFVMIKSNISYDSTNLNCLLSNITNIKCIDLFIVNCIVLISFCLYIFIQLTKLIKQKELQRIIDLIKPDKEFAYIQTVSVFLCFTASLLAFHRLYIEYFIFITLILIGIIFKVIFWSPAKSHTG